MGGMSQVRTSADPFSDTPKQGCFTIVVTAVVIVAAIPILWVIGLWNKYDDATGHRAARSENYVAVVISEHNDAMRSELASLCGPHVTGPIITVEGGKYPTESFYNVDQDFQWNSKLPRPRYVRRIGRWQGWSLEVRRENQFYIYAIFVAPNAKKKAEAWWSQHGYGSGGIGRESQAYEYTYGKSRGRLYLVDGSESTYLMENATKESDRQQLKDLVKAYQELGE